MARNRIESKGKFHREEIGTTSQRPYIGIDVRAFEILELGRATEGLGRVISYINIPS